MMKSLTASQTITPTDIRYDKLTAWEEGNLARFAVVRRALLGEGDERLYGRYWHVAEWYASPGVNGKLERGWLEGSRDSMGRRVMVDLSELHEEFVGIKGAIVTFIPISIDVLATMEVRVYPDMKTLRVSTKAPKQSGRCIVNDDCTFEEGEPDTNWKSMDRERVAYLWRNDNPTIGPILVYGDGLRQGVGAYYMIDFPAWIVKDNAEEAPTGILRV